MNDLDVPIVYLSGNKAGISGRRDIDQYPARLANDEDFPYINVGSVNFVGTRSYFSQGGDLLTVSAVGQDVTCASVQGTGSRRGSGTSYGMWLFFFFRLVMPSKTDRVIPAAPQVAGLLAYFMSQETVPFDTTTGSLVKNAKAFLKDTASWSRPGNNKPKVAWNLINSADNPPSS